MRTKIPLIVGLLSLLSTLVLAQPSGGDYTITRSTIDNGGGISAGGAYSLTGTVGQADASMQGLTSGQYQLTGGFWSAVSALIFKDSFESD